MVGGAPVTQSFADEIGADGFESDSGSDTKLGKTLAAWSQETRGLAAIW